MSKPDSATALDRREFLKLSTATLALLGTGALTASLAGCAKNQPPASGYAFLREGDLKLFAALAPVVLGATLPMENRARHIETVLKGIDATCQRVYSPSQKALYQLFDLLETPLTRRLAAGVASPWDEASADQVQQFLSRWSGSSIGLFNGGYRALTKFITGTWFGTPAGLAAAGYPGPWKPMFDAVNV